MPLILRTLVGDGRLHKEAVSEPAVRRLFAERDLDRVPLRDGASPKTCLRWKAERSDAMYHADVCDGPSIVVDGVSRPMRIHALLDDASRFIVAIAANHREMEIDMLGPLVRPLRRLGRVRRIYFDNGPPTAVTCCASPAARHHAALGFVQAKVPIDGQTASVTLRA